MARDGESAGAAGGLVTVTINGSGPYGFRLSGGDGAPLIVIKLRRQGKGHQAGVKEGDVVLGINGFNGRTMSHAAAMGLLESAVQSVELLVYRGPSDQVNAAFGEAESRLRPLPAGAAPPPRVLPPPPSTQTGEMVIDQPAYTRTAAEKFVVHVDAGQHNHLTNGDLGGNSWKPPPPAAHRSAVSRPLSALPTSGHEDWNVPAVPFRAPSPLDHPRTVAADYSTATWPIQREPLNQESVNFHVTHTSAKPWIWQPSLQYEVHTDVHSEPIQWLPLPELAADERSGRGGDGGAGGEGHHHHKDQPDHGGRGDRNGGQADESAIPRWALPLRSDYDWRKSYPWAGNENADPLDDEWEYITTSDGQLIKRKKKIFADSSFYDDPQHKYPTIEEQIKMARRVAQSLTAAGNVSARGQRMFMRRREKADRWVVSEVPAPNMATLLRHGGGQGVVRPGRYDDDEADAELYYNPAPWASQHQHQKHQHQKAKPATPAVKTPTMGARLPWKTDFDPTSEVASALRPPSPPPLPPPGASFNQAPKQWQPFKEPGSGTGSGKAPPKGASGAGSSQAFSLAKELRGMKGRGGKMFAKKRAEAAEAEKRDELVETLRGRSSTTFGGGAGHDEDWTDSAAYGSVEAELGVESPAWNRDGQPRLLELIERNRAASPGRRWTQSTTSFDIPVKDPSSYGNFSIDYSVKNKGSFRPVKFRTPGGATSVAPPMFEDDYAADGVPVSDF